jgi:hypothetical protein
MLKAILTPIKTITGRVRFFENLIRSRYARWEACRLIVSLATLFEQCLICHASSFYPESAVEAEEKPSPPIKVDSKCKRRARLCCANELRVN